MSDQPPRPHRRSPAQDPRAPRAIPGAPPAAHGGLAAWLPGSTALWMGLAAAVFALAVGLAFSLNGENGEDSPSLSHTAPPAAPAADATTPLAAPASDSPAAPPPGTSDPVAPPPPSASTPAASPLTGFQLPIDGACLTAFDGHLPNAPREYRNGIHEGLDFYGWASCVDIAWGAPVLAAKDGVVIRADLGYRDLTLEQYRGFEAQGFAGEAFLDAFRGRQIWIDHGNGIVTRYAHLSGIAAGVTEGVSVQAGEVIGFVGESGTPESLFAPGTDSHLHFEIRVGETYLGEGLDPQAARLLYGQAFGLEE